MPNEFVARNGIIARADSQISGSSTRITGSVIVTGSVSSTLFGFTGSLLGTASYVTGSVHNSSNPALSASYALTASYALNAGAGAIGGSGTANRVTKFTAGTTIGDSNITDDGTAVTISGSNFSVTASLITFGSASLNTALRVTGSVMSTGGFTGSILATNGVVSSSAFSSQAQGTLTASINGVAQNIDLGLQTTDNVTFAQVTGSDALFTGTVTVQTLIAQTVTSSVSFVTGSTKFGSQSSNTHQFTGSVSITGSLNVTGPATINNLTGSLFGTASWATNSTSATQVSSNLTQGTGVTNFTYNGSSAQTVAVSGASNLTANTHTKWTGTAFANGNITDDGVVVSVSASNFIVTASNVTIGSASLNTVVRITGSINSQGGFTGSLLGTASWATNATNATQLANNLTQGTGVTTFTYNGSSAQTVAVSGASNLTTNTHTKWTGTAFANGNITDDGIVVSVSASNFIVTSSNITLGSASLNSAIRISGSVNSQGGFTGSILGTSSWAVQSQTASRVSFNGQSPGGTTFAVPIVNTSGVGFGANVFQLLYLQNNLTYDDSTKILTATSSWASNSLTASFLNPLSQPNVLITSSVILTGSLIISGTSAGLLVGGNVTASTEAALVVGIPPSGVAGGEGGQIILQAPNSGGFNSASMIDNYQNKFRVLSGLNVQSNAERMSINMTTGQITLNNYTGSGVFAGSAQGYLAFDSSGNIITATGTGGGTTPGGSNTQIQYNNSNAFGGVSTLTFDGTTLRGTGSFSGSFTGNLTGTASYANYVTGSGTANRHAKFTANNTIGDSLISDDGSIITVSGSSLVVTASSITFGSASLNTAIRITGSVNSQGGFTGSLLGTSSWATNATTATQVGSNLTQGTGVTAFTYNGSSAQTVAVSGASNLTSNTHTKWTGTAFANGNITDDGIVISVSASNFVVTASNVTIGSASINTVLKVTGSVLSTGGFTGSLLGTASYVSGSVFTSANPALSASYALTASYANAVASVTAGGVEGSVQYNASNTVTGGNNLILLSPGADPTLVLSGSSTVASQPTIRISSFVPNTNTGGNIDFWSGSGTYSRISAGVNGNIGFITFATRIAGAVGTTPVAQFTINGLNLLQGGFTGSLLGTASYVTGSIHTSANPALSSSYALSSSFALTASYVAGGSGIGGSGTTNRVAKFTAGTTIGDSNITDTGTLIQITGSTYITGSQGGLAPVLYARRASTGQSFNGQSTAVLESSGESYLSIMAGGGAAVLFVVNQDANHSAVGVTSDGTTYITHKARTVAYVTGSAANNPPWIMNNSITSGSAQVTGSLSVTGSVAITGSVRATEGGFTGSLLGTSSWANNTTLAISSSYPFGVAGADNSTILAFSSSAWSLPLTSSVIINPRTTPYSNTQAHFSNFIGQSAGEGAFSASYSNFLGLQAGYQAVTASNSNFFGLQAGFQAYQVSSSNFFGYQAGYQAVTASNSNFFGYTAGYGADNASSSNFFGREAGVGANDASSSNFFGSRAGFGATNAYNSNFFGEWTAHNGTNAHNSNFFGYYAGFQATNANNSNFFGNQAGWNSSNSPFANFIGYNAGYNSSASGSNFIGLNAGFQSAASQSNFIGQSAGSNALQVHRANLIGLSAGVQAKFAAESNFIGYLAGGLTFSASYSNFIGSLAGYQAGSSSYSNFFGFGAGLNSYNASQSILIGYQAGSRTGLSANNSIGSNNIIIGTNITVPDGVSDAINLGGVIFATGSYSTATATAPFSGSLGRGLVGINISNPQFALHVSGAISASGAGFFQGGVTASLFGTSSWALNVVGGAGLKTKASGALAANFAGNPKTVAITFTTAFSDNNYSVAIVGGDARTWTIESKTSAGFTINSNSNVAPTTTTFWTATAFGES